MAVHLGDMDVALYLTALIISIVTIFAIMFYLFARQLKQKLAMANQSLQLTKEHEAQLLQDIETLNDKLKHAFEDSLTHLLGWQLFEDRLTQQIKESERYQFTLGVLFVDIDDFRLVNSIFGYEVGDVLLQEVAKRLQTCVRQVDSLSRSSKDTFVILLAQLAKPETAAIVAQRVLQSLKEPFVIASQTITITACIGIAIYPTDAKHAQGLLRIAEQALQLAKQKGKHAYHFYQDKLHLKSEREFLLYASFNQDDLYHDLVLYYQPIIDMRDQSLFGIDVSLYWQHKTYGLITPEEILHYAYKQPRLYDITEWMLKRACSQFLRWPSDRAPTVIAIPIFIKQLENLPFIYRLSQTLQTLHFDPHKLLLVIKTHDAQLSFDVLEKALNMLTYLGIQIAFDDIGADAFSLMYLKQTTIHYLMPGEMLVHDLMHDQRSHAVVAAIIFLAKQLSIDVIAKGVQNEAQCKALQSLGCSFMQGEWIEAAISEQDMAEKWLEHT